MNQDVVLPGAVRRALTNQEMLIREREKAAMKNKFKSGDICIKTATYAQFRTKNGECIGLPYFRYIREGFTFPQAERGCYFSEADSIYEKDENS
ncbi:hypothetical protein B6440_22000 [Salmonella enterica]|uniref:Uncharacterized protein n=1 Tax=Salmonella enterica TaxID=28901 RepID=A0A3V7Z126_SALER|nr:hypothetical protein [Salmonella enterica]MMS79158.1 hypothetical protein [Salmonella enterica]